MAPDRDPEGERARWREIATSLSSQGLDTLGADELDELGEAWFWCNEPWKSAEARRRAHQRWLADGNTAAAARSAWFVFYEHWLVGERSIAQGWRSRTRRIIDDPESEVAGWWCLAESDIRAADGDQHGALGAAERATRIGRATADPSLTAMGLQAEGRRLLALDRRRDGFERLDEAMVAVISDEVDPVFVGWIYCNLISICHEVGDIRRATEWCDAALRWCRALRDGLLYPGLCRVYSAQLAARRGDLASAERDAGRACEDLMAYDRRYAGAAHAALGDVRRMQGRFDDAAELYRLASELGHEAVPGPELLIARAGRVREALEALQRDGLADPSAMATAPLLLVERLVVIADLALSLGDMHLVTDVAGRASAVADASRSELVQAKAWRIEAVRCAAVGDPASAQQLLRKALDVVSDLGLTYEVASLHLRMASLPTAAGPPSDEAEVDAAIRMFTDIGAVTPIIAGLDAQGAPPHGLSAREDEVLRLVADGLTNREVADRLTLSEHTIARHLGNIYTKLGVRTRTAAVAVALGPNRGQD